MSSTLQSCLFLPLSVVEDNPVISARDYLPIACLNSWICSGKEGRNTDMSISSCCLKLILNPQPNHFPASSGVIQRFQLMVRYTSGMMVFMIRFCRACLWLLQTSFYAYKRASAGVGTQSKLSTSLTLTGEKANLEYELSQSMSVIFSFVGIAWSPRVFVAFITVPSRAPTVPAVYFRPIWYSAACTERACPLVESKTQEWWKGKNLFKAVVELRH